MHAGMRASVVDRMNAPASPAPGFKRQVVFRVGTEDWAVLEAAVSEHGSIQAAVLAGLRALGRAQERETDGQVEKVEQPADAESVAESVAVAQPSPDPDEEISAREAADLLGLKTATVRGYIRSGRLAGRYVGAPQWQGWLTTRGAVEAYRAR